MVGAAADLAAWSTSMKIRLPERRVTISFRVPASVKAHLQLAVDMYKLMAEARGEDPKDVDLSWVAGECLVNGLDAFWAQVGSPAGLAGMPQSDEEWAKLERSISKTSREDLKTRK